DPRGVGTSYTFDFLNRRIQTLEGASFPASITLGTGWVAPRSTATYDAAGNVVGISQGIVFPTLTLSRTTADYDVLRRQVSVIERAGPPEARQTSSAYDAVNNLIGGTLGIGTATQSIGQISPLNTNTMAYDPGPGDPYQLRKLELPQLNFGYNNS